MWHTIKSYVRVLNRNKVISFVNIAGFAISMTVIFTLVAFIIGEYNVNSSFQNKENIYRVVRADNEAVKISVPKTLYDDVKAEIPDVDKFGLYFFIETLYKHNNNSGIVDVAIINEEFLNIFSINYISKLSDNSLEIENNAVISRSLQNELFGSENPIGEVLTIYNQPFTIVGVVEDLPQNASFNFDIAISQKGIDFNSHSFRKENGEKERHSLMNAFIQLKPNSDVASVKDKISNKLNKWEAFKNAKLSIESLSAIYFNAIEEDQMEHANIKLIYLLTSISIIIILMAIFNYINITIASSYKRLDEIGLKRTVGADKKGIFIQLITESIFISFIAMFVAVFLSFASVDFFSELLGKKVLLDSLIYEPLFIVTIFSIIILIGLLGGLYPAIISSKIPPISLLNKTEKIKKRGSVKWILGLQFIVSIVLISSLIFIQKQLNFIKHKDIGFNKEQVVKLELSRNTFAKANIIKEELLKYPNISSVTASNGNPIHTSGSSRNKYPVGGIEKEIEFKDIGIDKDFLQTFEIKLFAGRNVSQNNSTKECLINKHLYKELQWKNLDGKTLGSRTVVGVVEDFNYNSLHTSLGNLMLSTTQYPRSLSIKIKTDIAQTLNDIKKTYKKFDDISPRITFYDELVQAMYQKEETQIKAITMFAFIAIVIAGLGLFGLSILVCLQKTKEIGIRKINGASIKEVMLLLNKEFLWTVIVAFVIATPIAYYAMNKWLENFAYKTTLSWWVFALAGLAALIIALFTVSWQSWRAASRNPVEALRYE